MFNPFVDWNEFDKFFRIAAYEYNRVTIEANHALSNQVGNLSNTVEAQQNTHKALLGQLRASNGQNQQQSEQIRLLEAEMIALRKELSKRPTQVKMDNQNNLINKLKQEKEKLIEQNEKLTHQVQEILKEKNSEKSKLMKQLHIEKNKKQTESETKPSIVHEAKPLENIKKVIETKITVNEFEIPDFTQQIALLALREKLLNNAALSVESYDELKAEIISMQTNKTKADENILALFKQGDFILNCEDKASLIKEVNLALDIFSMLSNDVKLWEKNCFTNVFYSDEAESQNQYFVMSQLPKRDRYVSEVSVLEQVQFLRKFYRSDLMSACEDGGLLLEKLDELLVDHLEILVYTFIQHAIERRSMKEIDVENEISVLPEEERKKLYATTSKVRRLLSSNDMPLLNGTAGHTKFIVSMSKSLSILRLSEEKRTLTWMRIFQTLWLTRFTLNTVNKPGTNAFAMLRLLDAFDAYLPSLEKAVIDEILNKFYEKNGDNKPILTMYLNLVNALGSFVMRHEAFIATLGNGSERSGIQRTIVAIAPEYHAIVRAFSLDELADLINCVIDGYQSGPAMKATQKQVIEFLRAMYQLDEGQRIKMKKALESTDGCAQVTLYDEKDVKKLVVNHKTYLSNLVAEVVDSQFKLKRSVDESDMLFFMRYDKIRRNYIDITADTSNDFTQVFQGALVSMDNNPEIGRKASIIVPKMLDHFEGDIKTGKLIFNEKLLARSKEKPEAFVRELFKALAEREHNYRVTTQGVFDLYIRFFRNPKTDVPSQVLLIEQKLLTCMTSLCDMTTKANVPEAIKQFKKANLLGMSQDELNGETTTRAILKDIINVYRETYTKLTPDNHLTLTKILAELEMPLRAASVQDVAQKGSPRRKHK